MQIIKLRRLFFLLIAVLLIRDNVFAGGSGVIGSRVMAVPTAYVFPTNEVEPANCTRPKMSYDNIWIVFSDRDNNPAFSDGDGKKPNGKQLKFMQSCFVIDEKGNFIHVIAFDNISDVIDLKKYTVTKALEDFGWMPKDKMLLWQNGLVDPDTKFILKALTVNSVKSISDVSRYVKENSNNIKLFNDPNLSQENQKDIRLFDFLFVFKKTDKAALIGLKNSLNTRDALNPEKFIYGWVSLDVINIWNQRLCLEPDGSPDAAGERSKNNTKTTIFNTVDNANSYKATCSIGSMSNVLWNKDPFANKYAPENKRLPVLVKNLSELAKSDVIKTGAVTDVFDDAGNVVIQSEDQANIVKEYNNLRKNYRNMNIVFVIDGSEIMENYYLYAKAAIQQKLHEIDQEREDAMKDDNGTGTFNYKVGAVIYRDYSEKNCPGGPIDFVTKDLTQNYNELMDFLDQQTPKNCMDHDAPQALFKGMDDALRMFQEHETESNVIIVIGAGGNRENDKYITPQDVLANLIKYQVSLFALQVKRPLGDAYEQFTIQLRNLINGTNTALQERYKKFLPKKQVVPISLKRINANLFKLKCPDSSPLPGGILLADKLSPMPPDTFTKEIDNFIKELVTAKEDVLEGLESRLKGQGERKKMNDGIALFLSNMNVDTAKLQKTASSNIQLFVEGYTPMKCDANKNPFYKYTLLLTTSELTNLMLSFDKLSTKGATETESRKHMEDAFTELIKAYLGPREVKHAINSMTADQIIQLLTGLPVKDKILGKTKIKDITNPKALSNQDFASIRELIEAKDDALNEFINNKDNSFQVKDVSYYWLPENLLP